MEPLKKKRGRRPIAAADRKQSYSLSLSPDQIVNLETKSATAGLNPSLYTVRELQLDQNPPQL